MSRMQSIVGKYQCLRRRQQISRADVASETFTVGKGWKSLRAEKGKAALAMATAGAARKSEYRCSHPSVLFSTQQWVCCSHNCSRT
jgi:hypothetical protein